MRLLRHALILIAIAACNSSTDLVCTEATCSNGLWLTVENAVVPWTMQVTDLDAGTTRSKECSTQCGAFFRDFMPARIRIVMQSNGFLYEQEVTPAYRQVAPNGLRCGPVCSIAYVTVDLAAASKVTAVR
jgi:hypothetical protein